MLKTILTKAKRLKKRFDQINELVQRVDQLQQALGRIETRLSLPSKADSKDIGDHEFKVYSQWGEDGIIQYLINSIEIPNKMFVEFGVQDYRESNTRFLLQHNNWSGLVMDSSPEFIRQIRKEPLYIQHNLRAECAFINRENINELLERNGIRGDIGLLSIDIDGMDYWVWEAITVLNPRIVICEYDSFLGCEHAVVTPYESSFDRTKAHYSFLYGGSSIVAITILARKKGYSLVGSNSNGVNAFFVRDDCVGSLRVLTPQEAHKKGHFRNSHDREGNRTFLSSEEGIRLIGDMPLFDIEKESTIRIRDLNHL